MNECPNDVDIEEMNKMINLMAAQIIEIEQRHEQLKEHVSYIYNELVEMTR